MRSKVLVVAFVSITLIGLDPDPAGATGDHARAYRPPVDAPVVDAFRPPTTRYGAGNRGVEYETRRGTVARAIGDGVVVFAGPVAGARHVTVRHADGLRSSYSFLERVVVRRGQRVRAGDVVGLTGRRLHLGIRDGDVYLDPLAVLAGSRHPRLVPVGDALAEGTPGEIAALVEIMRRSGSSLHPGHGLRWLRDRVGDATGVVRGAATRLVRHVRDHPVFRAAIELGRGLHELARTTLEALVTTSPCTPAAAAVVPPVGPRLAVLVAGLGSTSAEASIDEVDTGGLGYASADVIRFSYAGGRIPDPTDAADIARAVPARGYDRLDSQRDLRQVGRLLADLVARLAFERPGVPIDVIAHSQGGIVTRLAFEQLDSTGALPAAVDLVATIGSPHGGAPLASAVDALAHHGLTSLVLSRAGKAAGFRVGSRSASPRQLASGSTVLDAARAAPPRSVRAISIAGRGDLLVPPPSARLAGASNVVVGTAGPRAHAGLPGDDRTTRELLLALTGRPPSCESRFDRLLDALVGGGLEVGQRAAVVGAATSPPPL